jgi:hypothetical protein
MAKNIDPSRIADECIEQISWREEIYGSYELDEITEAELDRYCLEEEAKERKIRGLPSKKKTFDKQEKQQDTIKIELKKDMQRQEKVIKENNWLDKFNTRKTVIKKKEGLSR